MTITSDGWLETATRIPGPPRKTNGGINSNSGFVPHSAEGYRDTLARILQDVSAPLSKRVSFHLSNLTDGTLLQHYPFTAQCWHATAFNNDFASMENEGVAGEALTPMQMGNLIFVTRELSFKYGWEPRRPTNSADKSATLYEHSEVIRFGGSATACPSGRIPWDALLAALQEEDMPKENYPNELNQRRAREGLIAQIMAGQIEVGFLEGSEAGGYVLTDKTFQMPATIFTHIPPGATPT